MHAGIVYALLAAVLFGASTPLAKTLVGTVPPLLLAGLLYAGSGIGLVLLLALRRAMRPDAVVAWPARGEFKWLGGAIVSGGVAGPVLLMLGLAATPAATASLLLNCEGVLTAVLAWFVFRENFDARIALGMAAIAGGGAVLAFDPAARAGIAPGALLVVGACLCWAVDNNLTRRLAGADAIVVAGIKGLAAGAVNLGLAFALGQALPAPAVAWAAGAVGFAGYGVSLALFVLALRHLGAARTGAYFAVAPFVGAALAVACGQEPLTVQMLAAGALMAAGVWLHVTERHLHPHRHDAQVHEHAHAHDVHHRHEHDFAWDGREPHVHPHAHAPLVHAHAHYPDLHHRHRH